jgi:hypothetical protein
VNLVEVFNALIAKQLGLRPEQITDELIAQRRKSRARKPVEVDTNDYGGKHTHGLRRLTDEEVVAARESFEELTTSVH